MRCTSGYFKIWFYIQLKMYCQIDSINFPPNKELTKNLDTQPYDQFLKVGFFHFKSGLSKICRNFNTLSLTKLKVNMIIFVGLWH